MFWTTLASWERGFAKWYEENISLSFPEFSTTTILNVEFVAAVDVGNSDNYFRSKDVDVQKTVWASTAITHARGKKLHVFRRPPHYSTKNILTQQVR